MKKFTFLLFLMISVGMMAQIDITFTGSGAATDVDSVVVLNLKQGTTVTVPGSDVLQLVSGSVLTKTFTGESSINLYPNPAVDLAKLEFYNGREGQVTIEVIDLTGKLILSKRLQLSAGSHSMEISGLNAGIYIVDAKIPEGRYSTKLMWNSKNTGTPAIRHLSNNFRPAQNESVKKSGQATVEFAYDAGDWLLLKGYSGAEYSTFTDIGPTENATVNFEFVACTSPDNVHHAVVKHDDQVWMAENLKYLPAVMDEAGFQAAHDASNPGYMVKGYLGNDVAAAREEETYKTFGVYYNFFAGVGALGDTSRTVPSGVQGPCPEGWHVPSWSEVGILYSTLIANGYNYDGTTEGNKLSKAVGTREGWIEQAFPFGAPGLQSYPEYANRSGLGWTPSGYKGKMDGSGWFSEGESATMWSTTMDPDNGKVLTLNLRNFNEDTNNGTSNNYGLGYPMRCVKD